MSRETQESISQWAEETFGPAGSNLRVAARANEEMAELLRALTSGNEAKAPEEAADVVIVLCRLATRLDENCDLHRTFQSVSGRPEWYAVKANKHLATVIYDLESEPKYTGGVMATVQECVYYLAAMAKRLGTSLQDEIDKKMATNRQRVWKKDGSGHGYHVPAGPQTERTVP